MLKNISTERENPRSRNIDLMETADIVATINNEDRKVALAVKKALPEITKAVDIIAQALEKGGRLAYFGSGTSGRLGVLDAAECMPTFSVTEDIIRGYIAGGDKALRHAAENAEDSTQQALKDYTDYAPTKKDVIVAISASGNPAYLLTILNKAKQQKIHTIGITCNPNAKIAQLCDICITAVVGPEIITGSSRMKAGTAQKMILNMLSTATMIKIGKTYGNYMVDLTPTCEKLVQRSNTIIASICKISIEKADEYRIKAGYNVKTACVMYLKQCTKKEAEKLLKQQHGILRKVI